MPRIRLLAAALLLGACAHDPAPSDAALSDAAPPDGTPPDAAPPDAAPAGPLAVDLLFVIDNSPSMGAKQDGLAASFPALLDGLATALGGTPDLHVGVISTDLGIAPYSTDTCSVQGDDGALLGSSATASCTVAPEPFIIDVDDGAGGRRTNYTGAIGDTFSCLARLGTGGCGFEQPLASMKRALDGEVPGNAGFLRPGAFLAVVILSDEDDCSAADPGVFDTSQDSLDAPLGPFSSFRCAEFGVVCCSASTGDCVPDILPRTDGDYTVCAPRTDSYLEDPATYAAFLTGLKPDGRLALITITGPAMPFTVSSDFSGLPELRPSCSSTLGNAFPGGRFRSLIAALPETSIYFQSICNDASLYAGTLGAFIGARMAPM